MQTKSCCDDEVTKTNEICGNHLFHYKRKKINLGVILDQN